MKTLEELFDDNVKPAIIIIDDVMVIEPKDHIHLMNKETFIKVVEERDKELLLEYNEWWNSRDTITLVHTPEITLIEQFIKERKHK